MNPPSVSRAGELSGHPAAATVQGDFLSLQASCPFPTAGDAPQPANRESAWQPTTATTVLGFRYADGVLMAGDRRATSGNLVMFERADKVLEIDQTSLMAIAGSPAVAWEMARTLRHAFQFFRRTQLQQMSLDGKVRALSRLLRENLGLAMQGVGLVAPLFAAHDPVRGESRLYFYDALGAEFESVDFAGSGSGSIGVRGILQYEDRWSSKLNERSRESAIQLAVRALESAAEMDTATGGANLRKQIFPTVKLMTSNGIETVLDEELQTVLEASL